MLLYDKLELYSNKFDKIIYDQLKYPADPPRNLLGIFQISYTAITSNETVTYHKLCCFLMPMRPPSRSHFFSVYLAASSHIFLTPGNVSFVISPLTVNRLS